MIIRNNMENKPHTVFEDAAKQKLENFGVPVDDALWKGIHAGIKKQPKRIPFIPIAWMSTGIAAAIAWIIFINMPNQNQLYTVKKAAETNNTITADIVNKTRVEKTATYNHETAPKPTAIYTTQNATNKHSLTSTNKVTEPITTNQAMEQSSENQIRIEASSTHKPNEWAEPVTPDSAHTTVNVNPLLAHNDWEDPFPKNNSKPIEILAMVGSSNGKTTQNSIQNTMSLDAMRSKVVQAPTENLNILAPEDFTDIQYFTPLSFNVGIALPINAKFAIETGIIYTNLHTKFKDGTKNASLTLHYLGVPLRVSYQYFSNKKLNLYLASGVTIEKGLWSVYKQKINYTNMQLDTDVEQIIEGMQWSMHASTGISYRVFDFASLYLEPRLSYYFNSNQPMSIRTKSPLNVGIEGGFRFIINKN